MRKQTVKRRIFISNAVMVLVTHFILLIINAGVIKAYSEYIEQELKDSIEGVMDKDGLEELLEGYTIRRNDLTQDIEYTGDAEFENVCRTFNEMRGAILAGQEKNRKYEKARTDMIAGISHDLRTPLTAIRGTIKGLLDGVASAPERQKKFLETAYRRTGNMDLLLNQLFYLSKLETGNMPFDFQTIDLCEFIRNYVKGKQELPENGQAELTACLKKIPLFV